MNTNEYLHAIRANNIESWLRFDTNSNYLSYQVFLATRPTPEQIKIWEIEN